MIINQLIRKYLFIYLFNMIMQKGRSKKVREGERERQSCCFDLTNMEEGAKSNMLKRRWKTKEGATCMNGGQQQFNF